MENQSHKHNQRVRSQYTPFTPSTERKRDQIKYLTIKDKKGNLVNPVIKVVPNKALKVKDILDRYVRGLPTEEGQAKNMVWPSEDMTHDQPDMNKLSNLDRMEKKDLARGAKFKIPGKPDPSPDAIANPDAKPNP